MFCGKAIVGQALFCGKKNTLFTKLQVFTKSPKSTTAYIILFVLFWFVFFKGKEKKNQRSNCVRICAIYEQVKAQREKSHSLSCRLQTSKEPAKLQPSAWNPVILTHSVPDIDAGAPSLHHPNVMFIRTGGKCSCSIPSFAALPGICEELPQAKVLFHGVRHSTLETAWVLEVVCKYLQGLIKPIAKTGASGLCFKPLPQVSPPQHVMGSMCPAISCCLPNASRFILSLTPPHAFIGAQGLTSGSGWITKGFINPVCLGFLHE